MSDVPTALKALLPYIQRANEIQSRNPLVSFYCRTYAAQIGIDLVQTKVQDADSTQYLVQLMDDLEKEKLQLNPDGEEGRATVELFSLKMFAKADSADRQGKRDSIIAKLFYASSILMEVTKQFGEMSEDLKEKQKYARWRASEITKAIKSGTEVPPPPPLNPQTNEDDDDQFMTDSNNQFISHHEDDNLQSAFRSDDLQKPSNNQYTSHQEDEFSRLQREFFQDNNSQRNSNASAQSFNNPFMGSNNDSSYSHQQQETSFSRQEEPSYTHQQQDSSYSHPQNSKSGNYQHSLDPRNVQESNLINMKTNHQTHGSTEYNPPSSELDDDSIEEAQKYAKYSVSALQFYDVPAAIKNLEQALSILKRQR